MRCVEQRINHVRLADGTRVGYASAGSGPALLHIPGWVSHLELGWACPPERRFYEALATGRTLIRYDRPGCGLSASSAVDPITLEFEVIGTVLDNMGVSTVDVIGSSLSAPIAVLWASARPETVRRLVLYGGWVDGSDLGPLAVRKHILGLVEQHWGLGSQVLTEIFAPDADPGFRAGFAMYQREACDADTARRMLALGYDLDVSVDAAAVTAPTHVVHREGDRAVPLAEGRRLADVIPGATLTVLPGRSHVPFAGDVDALVDELRSGLAPPRVPKRFTATLTPRQLQVADLVAHGLSNRNIGERLVITERSAESHVERIRDRLGFRNRAQIAAWYVTEHAR